MTICFAIVDLSPYNIAYLLYVIILSCSWFSSNSLKVALYELFHSFHAEQVAMLAYVWTIAMVAYSSFISATDPDNLRSVYIILVKMDSCCAMKYIAFLDIVDGA